MKSTMRCDEVERELAAPTAGRDAVALADHLAGCARCEDWASQAAQLDRVWASTQPALPSAARWDALWDAVNDRLAAGTDVSVATPAAALAEELPADVLPLPMAARGWGRRGIVAFSLAQAAALVLAFGALLTQQPTVAVASTPRVEIDSGQIVVIRDDGEVIRQTIVDPDAAPNALDDTFAMFNALEAMAE